MDLATDCQLVQVTQSGGGGGWNDYVDEDFAWITKLERPKGAIGKVMRCEGPPTRCWGPEGPKTQRFVLPHVRCVEICLCRALFLLHNSANFSL